MYTEQTEHVQYSVKKDCFVYSYNVNTAVEQTPYTSTYIYWYLFAFIYSFLFHTKHVLFT